MAKSTNKHSKKNVTAIVVAAGRGERLKSTKPKVFLLIKGKPVLYFSLYSLSHHPLINKIVLVVSRKILHIAKRLVKKAKFNKVKNIIIGGPTRKDSVANGLKYIPNDKCTFALVHDGVRPFINQSLVSALIAQAFKSNAAICAIPVKDTIKSIRSDRGNFFVKETLDRRKLWEVHTPQIFRADLLKKAFVRFGHQNATDDAALIEKLGIKVKIVRSSYFNIKITHLEDLVFAKAIAKRFRW